MLRKPTGLRGMLTHKTYKVGKVIIFEFSLWHISAERVDPFLSAQWGEMIRMQNALVNLHIILSTRHISAILTVILIPPKKNIYIYIYIEMYTAEIVFHCPFRVNLVTQ